MAETQQTAILMNEGNLLSSADGSPLQINWDVEQETGQSTVNPMSQKAVTDELDSLSNYVKDHDSNPNLLINPNFKINQRGQTEYTTTNDYTVDRWKLAYGKLDVLNNGIKHTSSNTWQGIVQYIENPSLFNGKTITISTKGRGDGASTFRIYAYYKKENQSNRTTICTASTASTTNKIISATGTVPSDLTDRDQLYIQIYNNVPNSSIYCEWIKLEEGDTPTKYEEPNPITELVKCQRFYQKFDLTRYTLFGTCNLRANSNTCFITFPLKQEMRRLPTIVSKGKFRMYCSSTIEITNIIDEHTSTISACLKGTTTTQLKSYEVGLFGTINEHDGILEFDAEL